MHMPMKILRPLLILPFFIIGCLISFADSNSTPANNGDLYGCTARDFNRDNRIGTLSPDGETVFEEEKYFLRENAKFSKEICYFCRIAPICGGGCKQRAIESHDPVGCHFGYTDQEKDKMILDIFEHSFCRER